MKRYFARTAVPVALAALALAACDSAEEKKPATQIVAKVNKEEISVHQLNNLLARAGNISPELTRQASRQILERLIDQELLVQQAKEKKLDRDPKVMQAIEASRREILARAYLEQVAGNAAKPDEAAIKTFYDENPALFRERRLYNLQELVIAAKPEQRGMIDEQLKAAKSMNDLVAWLKQNNIPASANAGVKAAEQLPLELLPRVAQLKDGQSAVVATPGGYTVVHVAASQVRPLDEKAATPYIEQFLSNKKRTEMAAAEVKQLREKATIEYVGEFTQSDTAPAAAAQEPAQTAPAAQPADSHIEKGLSGLK